MSKQGAKKNKCIFQVLMGAKELDDWAHILTSPASGCIESPSWKFDVRLGQTIRLSGRRRLEKSLDQAENALLPRHPMRDPILRFSSLKFIDVFQEPLVIPE